MDAAELERAVAAARAVAGEYGLAAEDTVVVNNSDRVVLRLLPCDVIARVAPPPHLDGSRLEVETGLRLAEAGAPVGEVDARLPRRVHERDGFVLSFWTYYEPVGGPHVPPAEYGAALRALHAGLRRVDVPVPHFMDRVAEARGCVADPARTPELADADRALLADVLDRYGPAVRDGGSGEQVLHGEPHLENVLGTRQGALFIDLGTCCRGPVEFDLAHALGPSANGLALGIDDACAHYPGADRELVELSRVLIQAIITTWRWCAEDQLPNGPHWAREGLRTLRAATLG